MHRTQETTEAAPNAGQTRIQMALDMEQSEETLFSREKRVLDFLGAVSGNDRSRTMERMVNFLRLYESVPPRWAQMENYLLRYRIAYQNRTVYKPIHQIAAFENQVLPTIDSSHHEQSIQSFVWVFLQVFFSGEEIIKEDDGSFTLKFRSPEYRRAFYLSRLSGDATWHDSFFIQHHSELLSIITNGFNIDGLRGLIRLRDSELIESENDTSESYESPVIKFRTSLSDCCEPDGTLKLDTSRIYTDLEVLLNYARTVNFLSDIYLPLYEEIWAQYQTEEERHKEEYESAVAGFQQALSSRIVAIDALGHKTAQAESVKRGINEVFVPFEEKKELLPKGTPVYVYVNNSGDWFVSPPTLRPVTQDGLSYCGIFQYAGYNEERKHHCVTQKKEGVSTAAEYMIAVNLPQFQETLREHYSDWEHYYTVENSLALLAEYPKTFAKTQLLLGEFHTEVPEISTSIRPATNDNSATATTEEVEAHIRREGSEELERLTNGSLVVRGEDSSRRIYRITGLPNGWDPEHVKARTVDRHQTHVRIPMTELFLPGEDKSIFKEALLDTVYQSEDFLSIYPLAIDYVMFERNFEREKAEASLLHEHAVRTMPERFRSGTFSVYRYGSYLIAATGVISVFFEKLDEEASARVALHDRLMVEEIIGINLQDYGLRPGNNLIAIYDMATNAIGDGLIYTIREEENE